MILSVYIINSFSGLCLLSWSRILKKFDDTLIGGFLIAISRFGREIGGENAQFVDFRERKFIFAYKDKLIFVIEITSYKEVQIGRRLLQQIMVAFFRDYGGAKEIITETDVSILWPFCDTIEELISSQIVELERLVESIQKSSKASGILLLNLSGDIFSTTPRQIVDLGEKFIKSVKMILSAHESVTKDDSPFEIVINGLHQTFYSRRIIGDHFIVVYGPKEMGEDNLRILIQGHLDELASVLMTFGHIRPRAVGTETTIQKFLEWSAKHPLLSQLRFQEYEAYFDTIINAEKGLYEFDCVLKSPTNIAFIRIYRHFGQSDSKFIQRFLDDANSVCRKLDSSPVLFLAISKDNFSKKAREIIKKTMIQYKDKYFQLVLCKQTNDEFQIIEGLRDKKSKGGIL